MYTNSLMKYYTIITIILETSILKLEYILNHILFTLFLEYKISLWVKYNYKKWKTL